MRMRLPFNADRALTHVAANTGTPCEVAAAVSDQRLLLALAEHEPAVGQAVRPAEWGEPDRARLEAAARVAVVGEPDELEAALTWDCTGRSPNGTFGSRKGAIALATQSHAWLHVETFDVVTLWWSRPDVFVEWELAALQTEPLLIGDDILIEPSGSRIRLTGAAALRFDGDLIASAHLYWDDAALIEQVLALC